MATKQSERYEQHRYGKLLPAYGKAEFEELREDIRAHGQREAIYLYQGQVLDGWHRYQVCLELEKPPKLKEFEGDLAAALAFVESHNIRRRHLNPSQRAFLALELAKELETLGRGKKGDGKVMVEAAAMVNMPTRTAERAKAVSEKAVPAVVEAVKADVISLSDAEQAAKATPQEQRAALKAVKKGEEKTLVAAIQKARATETPSEDSEPEFDDNGLLIEGAAVFARADSEALAKLIGDVRGALPFLREVMNDAGRGQHLPQDAALGLGKIMAKLDASRFGCMCPYCVANPSKGKGGCESCKNTGWLPKSAVKNLPVTLVRDAKRMQKTRKSAA